jgi:hypothetical protein
VSIQDDPPAAGYDRKVPTRRRTFPVADQYFLMDYKRLRGMPVTATERRQPAMFVGVGAMFVGVGLVGSPLPLPSISYINTAEDIDTANAAATLIRFHLRPSAWRDVSDEVQAHFAHEALETLGDVVGFTAWASFEVDVQARASGNPLDFITRRIKRQLKKAFGCQIELVMGYEEEPIAGVLRFHIHGEAGLPPTRRNLLRLRTALRTALGSWDLLAKNRQIRFNRAPDAGWISYATKRAWCTTARMRAFFDRHRAGRQWRPSFSGSSVTMTNGIRRIAKELHEKARDLVEQARRTAWEAHTRPPAPSDPQPSRHAPQAAAGSRKPLWHRPTRPVGTLVLRRPIFVLAPGFPIDLVVHRGRGPPTRFSSMPVTMDASSRARQRDARAIRSSRPEAGKRRADLTGRRRI